jgi:segregation and condensation protein A
MLLEGASRDQSHVFTVKTEVFDGPLDLLLHLVKRDGISLARLEVSRIADAYLAYLDRMRELDLAIAADWLVMAATLCHLKALELLPRPPAILEPSEPDPRDQLLDQLRDYEQMRALASQLEGRPLLGREVFVRAPMEVPRVGRPYVSPVDVFGLLDVLHNVLVRGSAPEPMVKLGDGGPNIALLTRMVLAALGGKGGTFDLVPMLATLATRAERVITFIAVLEMARLGWVDVSQQVHAGPVRVEQIAESAEIDVRRVMGEERPPRGELVQEIA